jgi:hypothetical protein
MNEIQTLGESIQNAFNIINNVFQRTPGFPKAIINKEIDDIKNAITRLQGIANFEKNRADQAQAQVNQNNQTIRRLNIGITQAEEDHRLMIMAYHDEKKERRRWWFSYRDKHRRIGTLVQEKFATQLLLRNYSQQLQQYQNHSRNLQQKLDTCKNDLFLSDIQIDNKWGKWKNRFRNSEQIITNLNQNILNLQQNININQPQTSNMVLGYGPPTFSGAPGEDPEDYINELRRYTVASRIIITPGAGGAGGRAEVHGLIETGLIGDAKIWYINSIKNRNWQLDNIIALATGPANISALRGLNNGALVALPVGHFLNEALTLRNNAVGTNTITGADIIPTGVWEEDWSIAGGHPSNAGAPIVNPNVAGGQRVVAPGMTPGQILYELKYNYPTTVIQRTMASFGQIVQGNMSIAQFASKLRKIGNLAKMTPQNIREQWLKGMSPMNQFNIRQGGLFRASMDEQLTALTELEQFMTQDPMQSSYQPAYQAPIQPAYQAPIQPAYQIPSQPNYQAPIQHNYQIPTQPNYQAPKETPRQRRPKAVGISSFSVDVNGNPIAIVKPKKAPAPIPQKAIRDIEDTHLLKELYDMGYRDGPLVDFMDHLRGRGPSKNLTINPQQNRNIKPPMPRKPRGKSRAQVEQELEEATKKLEAFHVSTPRSIQSANHAYYEPPNSEDEGYVYDDNGYVYDGNGYVYEDNNEYEPNTDEAYDNLYNHNAERISLGEDNRYDPYEKKNV